MANKRRQRSNVEAQEQMVEALWDFAKEVCELNGDHSFVDRNHVMTDGQHEAICTAMERISTGYGYIASWKSNDRRLPSRHGRAT